MIGPTGVGKTEIARRLARLAQAPFLKVEASKFTEVGYVGRDVESMVRDLVEIAVGHGARGEARRGARGRRRRAPRSACSTSWSRGRLDRPGAYGRLAASARSRTTTPRASADRPRRRARRRRTREKFRDKLRSGALDERQVEIEVEESSYPSFEMFTPQGVEEVGVNLKDMLPGLFGARRRKQQVTVAEAREILPQQEAEKLIDRAQVAREARQRVEQGGIDLPRRDRQDRRPRGRARARRLARGRAARPAADRRGDDGVDQVRHGQDRPHPVHRRRRLPRHQALGPDPRAAGPLPDPGRARPADRGRTSCAS